MAFTTTHTDVTGNDTGSTLRNFFRGLGEGLTLWMESQARTEQIQRLQSKSDAELAKMGLERSEIVRHVFRDRFFV